MRPSRLPLRTDMKKLYILLSRSRSLLSMTIRVATGDPYTHVAIAFDRELEELYSSSRWNGVDLFPSGPCQEQLNRGLYTRERTPCLVYELAVEDDVYEQAKAEVNRIIEQQELYHYNILGLLFCFFGIPWQRKRAFFCSQFVGEILERSGALDLPRDPSLLRPSDYSRFPQLIPCFQGYTSRLRYQTHLWKISSNQ